MPAIKSTRLKRKQSFCQAAHVKKEYKYKCMDIYMDVDVVYVLVCRCFLSPSTNLVAPHIKLPDMEHNILS